MTIRTNRNQGFVSAGPNGRLDQASNGVWTTGQLPPPSYDHIYDSSIPINPLPDYESISKQKIVIKEEENVENITEQNQSVMNIDENRNQESEDPFHSEIGDQIVSVNNPLFNLDDLNTTNYDESNSQLNSTNNQTLNETVIEQDAHINHGYLEEDKNQIFSQENEETLKVEEKNLKKVNLKLK